MLYRCTNIELFSQQSIYHNTFYLLWVAFLLKMYIYSPSCTRVNDECGIQGLNHCVVKNQTLLTRKARAQKQPWIWWTKFIMIYWKILKIWNLEFKHNTCDSEAKHVTSLSHHTKHVSLTYCCVTHVPCVLLTEALSFYLLVMPCIYLFDHTYILHFAETALDPGAIAHHRQLAGPNRFLSSCQLVFPSFKAGIANAISQLYMAKNTCIY